MLYAAIDIHKHAFQAAVLDPDSGQVVKFSRSSSRNRVGGELGVASLAEDAKARHRLAGGRVDHDHVIKPIGGDEREQVAGQFAQAMA